MFVSNLYDLLSFRYNIFQKFDFEKKKKKTVETFWF